MLYYDELGLPLAQLQQLVAEDLGFAGTVEQAIWIQARLHPLMLA